MLKKIIEFQIIRKNIVIKCCNKNYYPISQKRYLKNHITSWNELHPGILSCENFALVSWTGLWFFSGIIQFIDFVTLQYNSDNHNKERQSYNDIVTKLNYNSVWKGSWDFKLKKSIVLPRLKRWRRTKAVNDDTQFPMNMSALLINTRSTNGMSYSDLLLLSVVRCILTGN